MHNNKVYFFFLLWLYAVLASARAAGSCNGDVCQWSSNLYRRFVLSQMMVPEGLWEIIAAADDRAPIQLALYRRPH